jgi:hypothetical protein
MAQQPKSPTTEILSPIISGGIWVCRHCIYKSKTLERKAKRNHSFEIARSSHEFVCIDQPRAMALDSKAFFETRSKLILDFVVKCRSLA